jgi:transglutaminase-like putative cysteine protease
LRCRRLLLLLPVLFLGMISYRPQRASADEWQPISPDELKMTSLPEAPGAPAVILYRQVDRKDLGRANTEYNYVRIKILTEEGRKYANVEIPFDRSQSNVSSLRARTVHPDGSIVNFDGKTYDQVIVKSKGTKFFARTFSMPDVQVGSIVEYHFNYDFNDNYVYDSRWILSDDLFTKKAVFTLLPYSRFAVRWTWPAGLPAGTEPPKEGPDRIIRMSAANIPAFVEEDYMPPANELKFRVDFIYSEDTFESNEDKYWRSFGKKQNGRVESFIGKHKAVDEAVAGLVSASDSPEEKLHKLYTRCQQLRNLSYEPFKTGEEAKRANLKPIENVDELLKNGYGNGYEITWVFLAMARAAGFDASPVLVANRADYFFNPTRMNSKELNSNVVVVKVNGKDLFFDPGAALVPYGLLPWVETAARGRKLDKDGGTWIDTPLPEPSASRISRKADLRLTDEGDLQGKVTITYTGLQAYNVRVEERNEDDTARKKFLEDQLKECVPAAIDVEVKNQPDWKDADQPFVVEYDVKIAGWASSAGKRALLPVGIFTAPEKHMFEGSVRVYPVYFHFPFEKVDDVSVTLPLAWQVGSLPKPLDNDAKAARYTLKAENNSSGVHFNRTLMSNLAILPKDSYPALRHFYQSVRSGDEQQIVLQQSAPAASN